MTRMTDGAQGVMTEDEAKTKWCPFVRAQLTEGEPSYKATPEAQQGEFDGVCWNCRVFISKRDYFCWNCGHEHNKNQDSGPVGGSVLPAATVEDRVKGAPIGGSDAPASTAAIEGPGVGLPPTDLRTALEEAIYEITHLSPRTCGPNEDSYKATIKAAKVDEWRAALAEAQQGEDVNSLIDEIRWVVGQLKTHRHSIEMKFERLTTGANVHAVNNAKHSLMAYLYRIQKKFEVLEGQD